MTDRTPLRDLYDEVTRINGWSLRDVERRGGISKSRIGQLIKADPLEGIQAGAIYRLAEGLGVSPDRVALAAIQSMGFRVSSDGITPAEAIARDETLSEDTRSALLAILRGARVKRGMTG